MRRLKWKIEDRRMARAESRFLARAAGDRWWPAVVVALVAAVGSAAFLGVLSPTAARPQIIDAGTSTTTTLGADPSPPADQPTIAAPSSDPADPGAAPTRSTPSTGSPDTVPQNAEPAAGDSPTTTEADPEGDDAGGQGQGQGNGNGNGTGNGGGSNGKGNDGSPPGQGR